MANATGRNRETGMNFQQLKIIRESARCNYNLTEVANTLFTSQSGVSRHIRELEEELGIEIFIRRGKRLLGMTEPGKELLVVAERILNDANNIRWPNSSNGPACSFCSSPPAWPPGRSAPSTKPVCGTISRTSPSISAAPCRPIRCSALCWKAFSAIRKPQRSAKWRSTSCI